MAISVQQPKPINFNKNLCSYIFPFVFKALETSIEEINKRLPDCIKVFGIKRVTNKFNSKVKCNARTYSYTLPTYALEPSLVTEDERKMYRISAEKLTKVNEILSFYKGTKGYHNFTEKK